MVAAEYKRRKWRTKMSKIAEKNAPFRGVWVPSMSLEGDICIGVGPDDEQTLLIPDQWVLDPPTWPSY